MGGKYKIGDKVVVEKENDRTLRHLRDVVRFRTPRTIVGIFYDNGTQHNRYYLGSNNRGDSLIGECTFRAEQLKIYQRKDRGRPREKRKYGK